MVVGDVQVQVRPDGAVHRDRARPRRGDGRPGLRRPRAQPGGRLGEPDESPGRRRSHAGVRRGRRLGLRPGRRRRVGRATVRPEAEEPGLRPVSLRVDPACQRRGIGTRLLVDVARLATALGAEEIVLTTRADNQAVLPMVMAAGLRGRIRMAADTLVVRIAVRELKPLRA